MDIRNEEKSGSPKATAGLTAEEEQRGETLLGERGPGAFASPALRLPACFPASAAALVEGERRSEPLVFSVASDCADCSDTRPTIACCDAAPLVEIGAVSPAVTSICAPARLTEAATPPISGLLAPDVLVPRLLPCTRGPDRTAPSSPAQTSRLTHPIAVAIGAYRGASGIESGEPKPAESPASGGSGNAGYTDSLTGVTITLDALVEALMPP